MALWKKEDDKLSTIYTTKAQIPQYLPNNVKPNIGELYDIEKYSKFIRNINESNLPEEEKEFLKFAATRHIEFNYSKIADYYAHSNKEMQALMEESALVIIDINDAIANGYVDLSSRILSIMADKDNIIETEDDEEDSEEGITQELAEEIAGEE